MKELFLEKLFVKYKIDFVKIRKISYTLSIIAIIVSFLSIIFQKFNIGIDFKGGVVIHLKKSNDVKIGFIRDSLSKINIGNIIIQEIGTDSRNLEIKIATDEESLLLHKIDLIKKTLKEKIPDIVEYQKIDFIGPQLGKQMIKSGLIAILIALLGIMLYIWIRFEWYFALGALLMLIHNVLLSLGFASILQLDFNLSTVAAILTILGYSVNDIVVVYDRIRENLGKFTIYDISHIINISIHDTLSRTIITSFTTLLANISLILFVGKAVESFGLLVFIGIIIGTYASIFISGPILILLRNISKNN
ncbi:protein translocase subunit SecF [Rickettsia endosymbiont of Cardiosporidium cionae]|uniref:protein translocase subunit SecF n=1 Tax=Rickettsia endosymbiont of Cardiosporidium cionae TaxID=2777155 RepID=UPI00189360F8|nr:protein translocase subunit SecF [Rickettsia endosymbiont of Cardiosporidium cionae]KAF8818340.1 protein translocase subunit SecF [Rickettsia endosymbiont of Cardiosporidium cionae]